MSGLDLEVRSAVPADLERLVPLFQALAAHYAQDVPPPDAARASIARALFSAPPLAHLLLAERAGRALGFLTWNTSFPAARLGFRLVVEDLFVLAEARGRGVGRALLRALAARAPALGAAELAWTTESANLRAQDFYDALGARRLDKVVYRIEAAALSRG